MNKKVEIKFSVGDTVKIPTGKSHGIIDSIKKGKAIVNYGNFKTQISLTEIELVKSKNETLYNFFDGPCVYFVTFGFVPFADGIKKTD